VTIDVQQLTVSSPHSRTPFSVSARH
jgi:hypothetical protein